MSIRVAPCNWPVNYCTDDGEPPDPLASMAPSGVAMWEGMATEYLWRWTGRRFGVCETTVRPCMANCMDGISTFGRVPGTGLAQTGPWTPVMVGGEWFNLGCGQCGDNCSCTTIGSLRLPGPVDSIVRVNINGTDVDPSLYRVDDARNLVRTDGQWWPVCQDLAAPTGSDNTWFVTYQYGIPVPTGGQVAAGVLAVEMAKAGCNDRSCRLPSRIQTMTREGITVAVLDQMQDLESGRTGIWVIDSWVSSLLFSPRPKRVRSPDYRGPRVRRQTWP